MILTKMSVIAYAPPLYVNLTPEIGDLYIISSAMSELQITSDKPFYDVHNEYMTKE